MSIKEELRSTWDVRTPSFWRLRLISAIAFVVFVVAIWAIFNVQ